MRKVSHNREYMKVIALELWNGNDLLSEKAFILVNSCRSCNCVQSVKNIQVQDLEPRTLQLRFSLFTVSWVQVRFNLDFKLL